MVFKRTTEMKLELKKYPLLISFLPYTNTYAQYLECQEVGFLENETIKKKV